MDYLKFQYLQNKGGAASPKTVTERRWGRDKEQLAGTLGSPHSTELDMRLLGDSRQGAQEREDTKIIPRERRRLWLHFKIFKNY